MSEIDDAINTAAITPKAASADGISTTARDLRELIEAAEYLAAQNATAKNHFGLRFIRLKPPGAGE